MRTVVSLFSGCGGLDLGFRQEGFELIYAADNDPAAIDAYKRNIDDRAYVRDVTSREFHSEVAAIGHSDVVLGGFPCQGFSKAGPKRFDDERNTLYLEMKQVIATLQPKIFVAENVDGMSQNFGGRYVQTIVSDFAKLGYSVGFKIVDAAAYDVPQHRRRIVFIGTRGDCDDNFIWPTPTRLSTARNGEFTIQTTPSLWESTECASSPLPRAITVRDAIGTLTKLGGLPDHKIVKNWPAKYEHIFRAIGPGQKLCNVRHAKSSVYTWQVPEAFGHVSEMQTLILETIGANRRHKKYGDIPNGNPLSLEEIADLARINSIEQADIDDLISNGYLKNIAGKFDLKGAMFCSGLFKRPSWDEPAPTVLTNFNNPRYFLHPSENRPLSLRECARLQGFPDQFVFSIDETDETILAGYRLVGNAVPPPMARHFARAVAKHLSRSDRKAA